MGENPVAVGCDHLDAESVHAHFDRMLNAWPKAVEGRRPPRDRLGDILAFPRAYGARSGPTPQERPKKYIRRCTGVGGIFPDLDALIRLVGAVLAEQDDEWTECRRYLSLELILQAQAVGTDPQNSSTKGGQRP